MHMMMTKLFMTNQKLVNVIFGEKQFWTETVGYNFMCKNYSNGSKILDLGV